MPKVAPKIATKSSTTMDFQTRLLSPSYLFTGFLSEDSGESSSRSSGSDGRGDGSDGQRSSEGSGSEASSQVLRPSRMVHWRIRFDQMDCRPTIYHPVRHPNTIAYPKKLFESAQTIATHSHLRWPDLSREWIRRQQARIARVDWESRLPCVLGPRKLRLSLFTRKQQKLLNKAREMEGVPDLSALLKGKLQVLSAKKSTSVVPSETNGPGDAGTSQENVPSLVDEDVDVELSAPSPKKKMGKTAKAKKHAAEKQQSTSLEENVSLGEAPKGSKKKKKKEEKKRSQEDSTGDKNRASAKDREDTAEDHAEIGSIEVMSEE
ncbi:hypothetical protein F2Q69_00058761 [Brassica cretica]|uniref:Uncharacterized protein n=1 Tax=Brassica cretica TaxID=69181 RepID=A0A8S9RI54_BRACR|nr:hypothetical protein F2Q69_00058761 [Brassica cretica]